MTTRGGPARGPWTNLGRLPLRVFSIGKYAFQKKRRQEGAGNRGSAATRTACPLCLDCCAPQTIRCPPPLRRAHRLQILPASDRDAEGICPETEWCRQRSMIHPCCRNIRCCKRPRKSVRSIFSFESFRRLLPIDCCIDRQLGRRMRHACVDALGKCRRP